MGKPTGPPPKLAEHRAVEGTGARSSVSHRTVPPVVTLAPRVQKSNARKSPPDMAREGRELWDEIVPWLCEVNVLQEIDYTAVRLMCEAYVQSRNAKRVIDEQGYFILGSMGQMTKHPALSVYADASRLFLTYAQEFGLTTVARTRLGLMDVQRRSIQQEMDWTLGPATRGTGTREAS